MTPIVEAPGAGGYDAFAAQVVAGGIVTDPWIGGAPRLSPDPVVLRREEARDLFVDALGYRNRYGLLAEDIHPQTGQLWGNFPQTYSMAGLILTAIRLSRTWEDRYWRG